MKFLAKQFFSVISPKGKQAKITILFYHRVLNEPDPMRPGETDITLFDTHLRHLHSYFNVLSLSEAIEQLNKGTLPERAVCITFDDGYKDNFSNALPLLKKWKMSATFFVTTGFLTDGIMWNDIIIESFRRYDKQTLDLSTLDLGSHSIHNWGDKRKAAFHVISQLKYKLPRERDVILKQFVDTVEETLPLDLMMTEADVKQLSQNGMEIGGHTVNHPILDTLDESTCLREISQNKQDLETIIDKKLSIFAYPNGIPGVDYNLANIDIVEKSGFKVAVTTAAGVAQHNSKLLQLPRFCPWDHSAAKFLYRLYGNYQQAVKVL